MEIRNCTIASRADLLPQREFRCQWCAGKAYKTRARYHSHLKLVHHITNKYEKGLFTCYHCPSPGCRQHKHAPGVTPFNKISQLRRHYQAHHMRKNVQCAFCQREFELERDLFLHTCSWSNTVDAEDPASPEHVQHLEVPKSREILEKEYRSQRTLHQSLIHKSRAVDKPTIKQQDKKKPTIKQEYIEEKQTVKQQDNKEKPTVKQEDNEEKPTVKQEHNNEKPTVKQQDNREKPTVKQQANTENIQKSATGRPMQKCPDCKRNYILRHQCFKYPCQVCERVFYCKSALRHHMNRVMHPLRAEDAKFVDEVLQLIGGIENGTVRDPPLIKELAALLPVLQKIQDS